MAFTSLNDLQNAIVTDLGTVLTADEDYNENLAQIKVKMAILDVKERRNYQATLYTEEQIYTDLSTNYYSTIFNLALYDYNQSGVEGEKSHSENSVNRNWVSRDEIMKDVHAFVGVLL